MSDSSSNATVRHRKADVLLLTIVIFLPLGVDYCIVRPAGLNDNWPAGSRPVFSQGDVAVGRINRKDVAKVLVDVLFSSRGNWKDV